MNNQKKEIFIKAFTVIELLLVIAIIGLISSIVFVSLKSARKRAQITKALQWSTSLNHLLGAEAAGIWNFDGGSGNTASDLSGYHNDGTIYGASWTKETPSEQGYALKFEGGQYVEIGDVKSLQITGDQTIAMWLYPFAFDARRNPYAKAYGGEGTITQEISGTLTYYYGTCGGNCFPYQGFGMGKSLDLNTWNHVAVVRDLSVGKLYWYKNGELVSQVNASYSQAATSSLPARIGRGYVSDYYGIIDDVVIYSQALPTSEIQKIYVKGLSCHLVKN